MNAIATPISSRAEARPDFLLSVLTAQPAMEWKRRRAELFDIRKYETNWDGLESLAPDPRMVDAALLFLEYWRSSFVRFPPVRVALSPSGTVSFEWQGKSGFHVEAELVAYNRIEWMDASDPKRIERWTEVLESDDAGNPRQGAAWEPVQQVESDAAESV